MTKNFHHGSAKKPSLCRWFQISSWIDSQPPSLISLSVQARPNRQSPIYYGLRVSNGHSIPLSAALSHLSLGLSTDRASRERTEKRRTAAAAPTARRDDRRGRRQPLGARCRWKWWGGEAAAVLELLLSAVRRSVVACRRGKRRTTRRQCSGGVDRRRTWGTRP
jgi:hypothetical protein